MNKQDPRPVSYSRTMMTELVMPNDTNPLGHLMGGNLMRWMDIAGGICAARHCGAHSVTASVDNVSFAKPIHLGDVITIKASVTRAFNTSVEIYLEVFTTSSFGADLEKSNHAYMTFVALDSRTSRPKQVPEVVPETEEEKTLFNGAARRREVRLVLAGRLKPEDAHGLKALFAELEATGAK
ncbi:MAG TPA: acyl-CoA thioesterase [Saprospiraceae bacterium]|jgi:acyl-CoA hydrolase